MFGIMFGFKVVAHLEDDSVGGLQNSITRMLQADPDFGKFILSKFFIIIPNCRLVSVWDLLNFDTSETSHTRWKLKS